MGPRVRTFLNGTALILMGLRMFKIVRVPDFLKLAVSELESPMLLLNMTLLLYHWGFCDIVLYCVTLCYIALYCIALHSIVLDCSMLCYIVMCCSRL